MPSGELSAAEGKRSRWGGWPSKPERVARRLLVGSTPTLFRQFSSDVVRRKPRRAILLKLFSCLCSHVVHCCLLEVTPLSGVSFGVTYSASRELWQPCQRPSFRTSCATSTSTTASCKPSWRCDRWR